MNTTSALAMGTALDEYSQFQDKQTGAHIHQLSQHDAINHSLFFLSPSFRPGHPDHVAWVTHRGGFPQVCLFDFATKQSQVLTEREDIQAFSASFSHDGAYLYYSTTACEIRRIHIDTLNNESIVTMPDHHLGECSLNCDDTHIVTAAKHGNTHAVIVVDIQARQAKVIHEAAFKIIHPQFHPSNPSLIEYAGDPSPRLWTIERDGTHNQNLYPSTDKEFFVHESFLGGSDDLIFSVWPYRLCRLNIHEKKVHTIVELNAWHMSSNRDGTQIVSDTAHPDRGLVLIDPNTGAWEPLCFPQSSCQGSQWKQDHPAGEDVWNRMRGEDGKALSWMEMKVDSVYGPQWTHPHPAYDDTGRRVIYTSDRDGHPQVYIVDVPESLQPMGTKES